jgi:hypothetical protein
LSGGFWIGDWILEDIGCEWRDGGWLMVGSGLGLKVKLGLILKVKIMVRIRIRNTVGL